MFSCFFVKSTKSNEDTTKMAFLTNDEFNAKERLNTASLFAADLEDLSTLHREHGRFLESQKLQPYADLLYTHIKEKIRPTSLLLELKEQLRATSDLRTVSVPLGFSFNAVTWHQSLEEKRKALGTMESLWSERETRSKIRANGWDQNIGTKIWWDPSHECWDYDDPQGNFDWELYSVRVHRVFRHTDLLVRINVMFGSQFEVRLVCTPPHLFTREGDDGFTANHYELRVYYLGKDLPRYKLEQLLAVAKKYEAHISYTLKPAEQLSIE